MRKSELQIPVDEKLEEVHVCKSIIKSVKVTLIKRQYLITLTLTL